MYGIGGWLFDCGELDGQQHQRISVSLLSDLYRAEADRWYRRADGTATGEQTNIEYALRDLCEVCGDLDASEMRPRLLIAVREHMIRRGLARTTIDKRVNIVRRMYRWACERELVPAPIWSGLQAIRPLPPHRSGAREPDRVRPVPLADVEATLAEITSPPIRAMVRLQVLTGMRPGEVMSMRGADLSVEGGCLVYRPRQHKTKHLGKPRIICLGPQARAIVSEHLEGRDPERHLFSPLDAPGPVGRRKADHYSPDAYRTAIQRACEMAGVDPWSPNQLRHTAATHIEALYGVEAAQAVLGHSQPTTTRRYAHAQLEIAERIMREIG